MNSSTRDRLLRAATRLFADFGYQGASVRDICNQAGANPGAVSYHFGGKKQLYRAVLRNAAATLAGMGPENEVEDPETRQPDTHEIVRRLLGLLVEDDTATRLMLRDLADGGAVAVEALTPPLRSAYDRLTTDLGEGDTPRAGSESRLLFLGLAAPLFLLAAGWPVVERALDLGSDQREKLAHALLERALAASGSARRPG